VAPDFQLTKQVEGLDSLILTGEQNSPTKIKKAYSNTIQELKLIPEIEPPMTKLEAIASLLTIKAPLDVDDFWADGAKREIDFESLHSLAIYFIVKANLSILFVDIVYAENFITASALKSTRGQVLQVFKSALQFIESHLDKFMLQKGEGTPLKEVATPTFKHKLSMTS